MKIQSIKFVSSISKVAISVLVMMFLFGTEINAQKTFESSSYFCTGKKFNATNQQKTGLFVVFECPDSIYWKPNMIRIINLHTNDTTITALDDTKSDFKYNNNAYFKYRIADFDIFKLQEENLKLRFELIDTLHITSIFLFDEFTKKILQSLSTHSSKYHKTKSIIFSRINCIQKDAYFEKLGKLSHQSEWFKTWEGGHERKSRNHWSVSAK